jgi:hypothetical protein
LLPVSGSIPDRTVGALCPSIVHLLNFGVLVMSLVSRLSYEYLQSVRPVLLNRLVSSIEYMNTHKVERDVFVLQFSATNFSYGLSCEWNDHVWPYCLSIEIYANSSPEDLVSKIIMMAEGKVDPSDLTPLNTAQTYKLFSLFVKGSIDQVTSRLGEWGLSVDGSYIKYMEKDKACLVQVESCSEYLNKVYQSCDQTADGTWAIGTLLHFTDQPVAADLLAA